MRKILLALAFILVTLPAQAGLISAPPMHHPSAFVDPTSIGNLALWLDASNAASITSSVGKVSQWNDLSGNGYNATQGTGANQPSTGVNTINSLNVLTFTGASNTKMSLPSGLYSGLGGANNTIFVVGKTTSTGASQYFINAEKVASSTRYAILLTGGNTFSVVNETGGSTVAKTITVDTNPHIMGFVVSAFNSTGLTSFYDGATTVGIASSTSLIDFTLGNRANNTNPLTGYVAEVIVYKAALTNAQINQVSNYLAAKWGTTWTNM